MPVNKKVYASGCSCCCPPLFGTTCLLPPTLNFIVSVPCICPEVADLSGTLSLSCWALCNDPTLTPITACRHGWNYYCPECVSGQFVQPIPSGGTTGACGEYCCCAWTAQPSSSCSAGPCGGTMAGPGLDTSSPPCIDAINVFCAPNSVLPAVSGIPTYPYAFCKHGPQLPRTGRTCNWWAEVSITGTIANPCTGPCNRTPIDGGGGLILFGLDCSYPDAMTGQSNLLGCSAEDRFTCPGAALITDPVTGYCRRKLYIHMGALAYDNGDSTGDPITQYCTAAQGQECYIEIGEP